MISRRSAPQSDRAAWRPTRSLRNQRRLDLWSSRPTPSPSYGSRNPGWWAPGRMGHRCRGL